MSDFNTGDYANGYRDGKIDAEATIITLRAENERLRAALEQIAKWRGNDLVTDARVIQMENIARAALEEGRT